MSLRVNRVYKYRLYPTKAQEGALERQLELCRRLYNKALWWREREYKRDKTSVTRKEQVHALVDLKQWAPEYAEISRGILEDVVNRVDLAFKAFFRRCKQPGEAPGYPRPKGSGWYKSFTITRSREFKVEHEEGAKYGWLSFKSFSNIRVRMHRPLPEGANVRRAMIKREANGHWYVMFGWDIEADVYQREGDGIGLDVGLSDFITTDRGEKIAPPRNYKRLQRKLRRKQRILSRRKRGSNRRKRARAEVAKVHAKIRNRRLDFLHNVSRKVVDSHAVIALEKLKISNMSKNPHLPGSILDAGWGEFASMLAYKAESAGGQVVLVDPKNTSQICSGCGGLPPQKKLSERTHRCGDCGLVLDRDHNAAINILNRAVQAQRGVT